VLLFGRQVPSSRGPISLALRSEAPVGPMYLVRNYGGDMNLIIEPAIELLRSGSLGEDLATNTRGTVRLNKHHLDRTPDLNVSDSSNLDLLPEDRKKGCSQASMEKKTV
jgi:hypothetical protein